MKLLNPEFNIGDNLYYFAERDDIEIREDTVKSIEIKKDKIVYHLGGLHAFGIIREEFLAKTKEELLKKFVKRIIEMETEKKVKKKMEKSQKGIWEYIKSKFKEDCINTMVSKF